jgi:hypothetical protein
VGCDAYAPLPPDPEGPLPGFVVAGAKWAWDHMGLIGGVGSFGCMLLVETGPLAAACFIATMTASAIGTVQDGIACGQHGGHSCADMAGDVLSFATAGTYFGVARALAASGRFTEWQLKTFDFWAKVYGGATDLSSLVPGLQDTFSPSPSWSPSVITPPQPPNTTQNDPCLGNPTC